MYTGGLEKVYDRVPRKSSLMGVLSAFKKKRIHIKYINTMKEYVGMNCHWCESIVLDAKLFLITVGLH